MMSPKAFFTIGLLQRGKNNINEPVVAKPTDFNQLLLKMLAHENIASRAPIFETYDKQVQGRTIIEAAGQMRV